MKDVVSLQYVLKNKLDAGEIDKKVVFPTFGEVESAPWRWAWISFSSFLWILPVPE